MPTELYIYSLIQITISADSESYLVFPVREKIRIDRSLCPLHTISNHLQAGSSARIMFRDREREPINKYEKRSLQSSPTEPRYAIIKWDARALHLDSCDSGRLK